MCTTKCPMMDVTDSNFPTPVVPSCGADSLFIYLSKSCGAPFFTALFSHMRPVDFCIFLFHKSFLVPQMDALGLLRIRVLRGINLAVRDTVSSDPYAVITYAGQRVKTRVVKRNCNPLWNEELTISIKNPNDRIVLSVYDKDTFTSDDSMGDAEIDIKPYIECLKMGLQGLPDGTKVDRVQPSRNNFLADESCVIWIKGKMTQDMVLRLRNVECGEVVVQIEWIDLPGSKGIQSM